MAIVHQLKPSATTPSLEAAFGFLSLLDPDAGHFHFQTYSDTRRKPDPFAKEFRGSLGELFHALTAFNTSGAAVCVAVNNVPQDKPRHAKHVDRIRAIVMDDDTPRRSHHTDWPLKPSMVVESSPGKFHYYWMVDGLTPRRFAEVEKTLVARYGHDPRVTHAAIVLRLPGFIHQKGESFRSRMVTYSTARYTKGEILSAFPPGTTEPQNGRYVRDLKASFSHTLVNEAAMYIAHAKAWTFRQQRQTVMMRFRIYTDEAAVDASAYFNDIEWSSNDLMRIGGGCSLAYSLRALRPDVKWDFSRLPVTAFDEFFERDLRVEVKMVKRRRDPVHKGEHKESRKHRWYVRVVGVEETIDGLFPDTRTVQQPAASLARAGVLPHAPEPESETAVSVSVASPRGCRCGRVFS